MHVDVFDGSSFSGGALSSMGPATVAALRAAAPTLQLDVHLGVSRPAAVAEQVAAALGGVGRITLQWEVRGGRARHRRCSPTLQRLQPLSE